MRKSGSPRNGEVVVCRIEKIHPNSAFAQILDYNTVGMIHVSEVAKKWIRDIRDFIKENQFVVCKVMKLEERTISLSIKRVHRDEANRKLGEFKRERRAEKLFEQAAKLQKKGLDDAYKEVGEVLEEGFGTLQKVLETAFKNPELLEKKGVPKKWVDSLVEIAKKSYTEKVYTVRGRLELVSYSPDGVDIIRKALKKGLISGRGPTGVAAAALYITSAMHGEKKTQKEVADVAGVTEVTIRNRYRELKKELGLKVNL